MLARTPRDWGLLVREQRRTKGVSQAQLADILGVTRQWVVSFEKGASTARFSLALQAAEAVGLEISLDLPQTDDDATVLDQIAPPPAW